MWFPVGFPVWFPVWVLIMDSQHGTWYDQPCANGPRMSRWWIGWSAWRNFARGRSTTSNLPGSSHGGTVGHGSSMVVSVAFAYGSSLWIVPPHLMRELDMFLSKDAKMTHCIWCKKMKICDFFCFNYVVLVYRHERKTANKMVAEENITFMLFWADRWKIRHAQEACEEH